MTTLDLPPKLGGKYRPIRHLASGGMGAVYEVEHEMTGEHLALKVLKGAAFDATALERFRREARVHSLLKSEHIVRVIDADLAPELGGTPYLVMDLLEGENLGDLTGEDPQPASRVVGWLNEIAAPLDAAHAAGIVHRDLKPENLFLAQRADGSGIVKILDFGIAKSRDGDSVSRTNTGAVVGTPLYMAPEQAAAEHDRIGPATDVWSIGMIAFRLLTGRPYWTITNVSMLLVELVSQPVRPPSAKVPKLSPAFDLWFLHSCARDPAERYASVSEQVVALAEALGVELPEPIPTSGARLAVTSPDLSRPPGSGRSPQAQSLAGSVASTATPERKGSRALIVAMTLGIAGGLTAFVMLGGDKEPAPVVTTAQPQAPTATPTLATTPAPAPSPSQAAQPEPLAPPASASAAPPMRRIIGGKTPLPASAAPVPVTPAPSVMPSRDPLADPK